MVKEIEDRDKIEHELDYIKDRLVIPILYEEKYNDILQSLERIHDILYPKEQSITTNIYHSHPQLGDDLNIFPPYDR